MSSPRDIILEQNMAAPDNEGQEGQGLQPVTEAQSDQEPAPEQPPAPKRRPGRPPGSKNKTTRMREAARRAETPEALPHTTLDVEKDQILGEKKRAPKRKARPRKVKTPEPSSESSDASTVEPAPCRHSQEPDQNASQDAPRAVRMERRIAPNVRMSYIEALTHGLNDIVQERSRARSAKYAAFFSKLK